MFVRGQLRSAPSKLQSSKPPLIIGAEYQVNAKCKCKKKLAKKLAKKPV